MRIFGVHTCWGFPVEEADRPCKTPRLKRKQAGVAIIIAVMVISLMMVFTADMILNSQVNLELVSAARDNVTSEYLAKSGYNLALFLLSIDYGIDLFKKSNLQEALKDGREDIWAMLNGIPIGQATSDIIMETFALNPINDEDTIKKLQLFQGEFSINVTDESSKINVNYCASGAVTPACKQTQEMLLALFNCPIEKTYLESKNIDPVVLVKKMQDWVDSNDRADPQSGVSSESSPYMNQSPPYKTKNSQFDSVDELKLIDQWDDDLHVVFSPYLTVYPFKKTGNDPNDRARININTVSRELLACLIPEARESCSERFDLEMVLAEEGKTVLGLDKILREISCLPKEDKKRRDWFSESSSVYRIEVKGVSGFQEKILRAVIHRQPTRIEKKSYAYKILFWKMT